MKFNPMKIAFILILAAGSIYSQGFSQVSWVQTAGMNDTLIIKKLVNIAIKNNPSVKIFNNNIDIAESDLTIKKLSWLNAVSLSYNYYPGFINSGTSGSTGDLKAGIGLSVNLGALFQVPLEISKAGENVKIQKNSLEAEKLWLYEEITKRLTALITGREMVTQKLNKLDNSENNLVLVRYRFEKGEETLTNYNGAMNEVSESIMEKIKAEAEYYNSKASLEAILGTSLESIR